jgi:hypothetical protein
MFATYKIYILVQSFNTIKNFFLVIISPILLASCANIIPPTGGAKDTLAPVLIASFPKDSTLNFSSKKITLTFNEYIEAKDIQQNLLMNPVPVNQPSVDYKLQNVIVTLKDSLEPNTTYSLNFGNAIKDINEGNIAINKTYIFSTGKTIDKASIKGNIILAKDGKVDSSLIVVLHPNLNDTAVVKLHPRYLTKLDGKGNFKFNNLPNKTFNVFVLPDDYTKKYDDSTKLFGFLNQAVLASDTTPKITLYAYREVEPVAPKQTTAKQDENGKPVKEDKRLKYATNLTSNRFDVLDSTLQITFNRKIMLKNNDSIRLLDTGYNKLNGYTLQLDSVTKTLRIKHQFALNKNYILIIDKNAVADTTGITLTKADTIKFSSFIEEDYGNIKLRMNSPVSNGVLQILKDGKLQVSYVITSKEIKQKLFKPGEYDLQVLLDENNNGVWDAGNYKQNKQPEKVLPIKNKLVVKANWDNEMDLNW